MYWLEMLEDWPTLETERLILRRMRMEDMEDIFEYASDPEVTRYVVFETHQTLDDTKVFLERVLSRGLESGVLTFAVELKETRRVIGNCSIWEVDDRSKRAEVGYAINSAYRGKGYAPEALRAVIDLGFGVLRLNRIAGLAMLDNPASVRVMEKAGMRYEGTLREYMMIKGRFYDLQVCAVVRQEWEGRADARNP
ncbi:MAG: GNAT family N-acetyltransferase [Chloroflexia bacterium]